MSNLPYIIPIKCVRTKIKYPGAYPAGFLETARELLGDRCCEKIVWHVPGGMAHKYNVNNNWGFAKQDIRFDMNPDVKPDIYYDIRELDKIKIYADDRALIPRRQLKIEVDNKNGKRNFERWDEQKEVRRPYSIIIDRDYTEKDADSHFPGKFNWPESVNFLLKESLRIAMFRVGVLDYVMPSGGKYGKLIYVCPLILPANNRARYFTVWERVR